MLCEAEELLKQFLVLYPDETMLRLAIRGWATYQLNWFDAHLWAYAEHYGLSEIFTEDLQHDRFYGTVRVVNIGGMQSFWVQSARFGFLSCKRGERRW